MEEDSDSGSSSEWMGGSLRLLERRGGKLVVELGQVCQEVSFVATNIVITVLLFKLFGFLSSTLVDVDHDASPRISVAELVCQAGLSRLSRQYAVAPCTETVSGVT